MANNAQQVTPKGKRGGVKVDPNETKAQRFKRLGTIRVNNLLKAFDRAQALTGASYECSDAQAEIITTAVKGATENLVKAFENRGKASVQGKLSL